MGKPLDDWINSWSAIDKSRLLLSGYIEEQSSGLPIKKYLDEKADAAMVVECRVALATVLSTGRPSREICELLAGLIAPDGSAEAGDRKITFAFRGRGRKRDAYRDTEIVVRVKRARERGATVEAAISAVAGEIGLKEETVAGIWKRYKPARDAGVI